MLALVSMYAGFSSQTAGSAIIFVKITRSQGKPLPIDLVILARMIAENSVEPGLALILVHFQHVQHFKLDISHSGDYSTSSGEGNLEKLPLQRLLRASLSVLFILLKNKLA